MTRPMTPEFAMQAAKEAREGGYEELANIFESLATKFARFNETSVRTIDEIYRSLGHERFWALLDNPVPSLYADDTALD